MSKLSLVIFALCLAGAYENPLPRSEGLIPSTPKELQLLYGDALEAIFGIGIRLHGLLADPDIPTTTNFMVSPLSIAILVGQLMLGAEGKFREDLYNLLSLPNDEVENSVIKYYGRDETFTYTIPYSKLHLQLGALVRALERHDLSKSFTLNANNALFIDTHLKLRDDFVQLLKIYQSNVKPVNFSTDPVGCQKTINDWASTQTNGVIKTVLPAPLPISASAVFANAIYFKADWETPFSYEANIKGSFSSSKDTKVEVEYMRGFMDNIPYIESAKLGCKMIALPYKNNELAMYFLLPNENATQEYDIRKFSDSLQTKHVLEAIPQMKKHSVALQIPKMQLSNSLSLLEPLQKYYVFQNATTNSRNDSGDTLDVLEKRVDLYSQFNSTEDVEIILTGAAENESLKISNLLQQMTLSVDEKGTEAAAVTLSIIDYIGGSKNFRLDRPFVFFIRHELTSAVLFWGAIVNPTEKR